MSIEKAREYLIKKGFDPARIIEFDTSSATVELAAEALGCDPEHIAKSITFSVNGEPVMILAAGDTKIDNPKYKAYFGTKAKMLTAAAIDCGDMETLTAALPARCCGVWSHPF